MDPPQGQAYDPTRPWAVTDALLGILARSLLKSTSPTTSLNQPSEGAHSQSQQMWQQGTSRKPATIQPHLWSNQSTVTNGVPTPSLAVAPPTLSSASSVHYAASQHQVARNSPSFQGRSGGDPYSSHNSHGNNNDPRRVATNVPSHSGINSNHDSASAGQTPGLHDDVAPMMIDPNLASWQGDDDEDDHEPESFLHQYSEMGGDYTAVPANMIDPNLALLHDHEDYRHGRHDDDDGAGHMDELDPLNFGINFHQGRLRQRRNSRSPYFAERNAKATQSQPTGRRPRRGTVSCIPFPPLTAASFGLIQEQLAHDPFRLLIAVTFLVKTKGTAAIPTFHRVMRRFPTPGMLADKTNADELTEMIRHLGLSTVRVAAIQRYAEGWVRQPPKAGARFKVKNYPSCSIIEGEAKDSLLLVSPDADLRQLADVDSPLGASASEADLATKRTGSGYGEDAWEIGHLTQGRYAIDSWRIFCRDELLGKAVDWDGGGREPEFQPEWMRVLPQDKELRAYLRWKWMKEGFEWAPLTGEKTVLSAEMRMAVEEGRIVYNPDDGGLEIVDAVTN